jgi:hypothetical protein
MTVVYNIILVDDPEDPLVHIITFSAALAHNLRRAIRINIPQQLQM